MKIYKLTFDSRDVRNFHSDELLDTFAYQGHTLLPIDFSSWYLVNDTDVDMEQWFTEVGCHVTVEQII